MRIAAVVIAPLLLSLSAASALSAEAQRYQMEKTDKGYVRMDTQTGEMSICVERDNQLVCKLAAEERSALQDEIGRLQTELKAIDQRIVKLENSITARVESTLPSEEEFEKTLGYMDRFFRNFLGIVKDFEKQDKVQQPAPAPAPAPDKT